MLHSSDPFLKHAKLYVLRHTSSSPESHSRVCLSFHNEAVLNFAISNLHNQTCRVRHRNNDRLWSVPFSLISAFIYLFFIWVFDLLSFLCVPFTLVILFVYSFLLQWVSSLIFAIFKWKQVTLPCAKECLSCPLCKFSIIRCLVTESNTHLPTLYRFLLIYLSPFLYLAFTSLLSCTEGECSIIKRPSKPRVVFWEYQEYFFLLKVRMKVNA